MPSTGKTRLDDVTPETIKLWGGALCLDFANSVDWTPGAEPVAARTDALRTPQALVRWGRRLGVAGRGLREVDDDELVAARALRLVLHRIFSSVAAGARPARADLDALAREHAQAAAAGRLTATRRPGPEGEGAPGGFRLDWPAGDPRRVRFAVAVDAMALLGDPARLARVHRCPGPDCGWLFLDTSGRRRWCSMTTCGSRVKMRRLYERRQAAQARK